MKFTLKSGKGKTFSKQTDGIKFFFWVLAWISVLLLLSPLLLNSTAFYNFASGFTAALGKEAYKEGYIGLVGGLIGSALGVVGALFVMHLERKKEMLYAIRVNARITFYDIELFYVEFSALSKLFLGAKKPDLSEFEKQKEGVHLLINPNWISTVAELGDRVLNFDQVSRVYLIYGVMQRLDSILQNFPADDASAQLKNLQEIDALFHRLGKLNQDGNFVYHTGAMENVADSQAIMMGDIMELLKDQIQ